MLMLALGVILIVVMPETGFQPASRGERTSWSAAWHSMVVTAGEGMRLVRFTPLLSIFLLVATVLAATGEALDRLGEAHFIRVIGFPGVIHLEPIVWFGLISLGSSLLGLLAAEAVIRRLDTSTTARAANALFIINALRLAAIVAFGLAGNFWLALAAYWSVGLLGSVIGPIQDAWLNRSINPSVRATVFSVMGQADALGQLAGGPAIGVVGTRFGLRAAMVTAGLALSPALLLYSRARHAGQVASPEMRQARDGARRDPVE
jgi:DHA3 family tetracycline resistance protein-like MFS transporter